MREVITDKRTEANNVVQKRGFNLDAEVFALL